jgi:signal peptidase I
MERAKRNRIVGIAASVVVVALGLYLVFAPPFRTFINSTASMEPTLPLRARIVARSTNDVHVGEIVVFRYPLAPGTIYVKRIVAGPGDEIEIRAKRLFVNGREVNEPYAVHEDPTIYPLQPALPEPYRSRDNYGPYRVPKESYFVLGDNRDRSADSRFWGVVPHANIVGRVVLVVSPKGLIRPR